MKNFVVLALLGSAVLFSACGDDIPAAATNPTCGGDRSGVEYAVEYAVVPIAGDTCGTVYGGSAWFGPDDNGCVTRQSGVGHTQAIQWSPDGARGDGVLMYSEAAGARCTGTYLVTFVRR